VSAQEAAPVLCLGVGNPHRRDDGVGPAVVRALAGLLAEDVDCRIVAGEVARLVAAWEGYRALVIVDAVATEAVPAGALLEVDYPREMPDFASSDASSHGLGVGEALRLSEALGTLPPRVALILIAGADFGHGEGLSAPVEAGLAAHVAAVARQIARVAADA